MKEKKKIRNLKSIIDKEENNRKNEERKREGNAKEKK